MQTKDGYIRLPTTTSQHIVTCHFVDVLLSNINVYMS